MLTGGPSAAHTSPLPHICSVGQTQKHLETGIEKNKKTWPTLKQNDLFFFLFNEPLNFFFIIKNSMS